jgi:hypothetical protein
MQRISMSLTHSPFAAILPCTFFSSPLLVSALALSGLLISADTTAQTATMLDKLKRNEQISCKPIEPNFCLNMHVSCAGKTNYQAFAFNLQATEKKGDLTVAKEFDQFSDLYASANVQWSSDSTYVIFSPASGKGYIKMFDNGKYVFRYYPVNHEGIMSLGMCQ